MIEQRLADAAEGWCPPAPPLAARVLHRLPAEPDPVRRRVPRAALVIALAVLLTGTAVAATIGDLVPGVRVHRVERLRPVPLVQQPTGRPVPVGVARSLPFAPLLPAGLGEPRLLLDHDLAGAPVLTAVYGDKSQARLVLTQWIARTVLFEKLVGNEGARTELVDVDGAPGEWIEGAEHEVFYLGESSREELRLAGRLAGNTLIWHRGDVSYRLEAQVSLQQALALARSLRRA